MAAFMAFAAIGTTVWSVGVEGSVVFWLLELPFGLLFCYWIGMGAWRRTVWCRGRDRWGVSTGAHLFEGVCRELRVVGVRRRDVARWLGVVGVVVVAACSGSGKDQARIVYAELQDERTLLLDVSACNADNNGATVNETAQEVTVTVVTDDPSGGDDCADRVRVVLDEPLGERALIDGSTGGEVEVHDVR